jgi:long-chain acyl-CoA synthetase
MLTSADKMPPSVAAEFTALTGARMAEGYGLTETCGVALGQLYSCQKEGSVGIPIPLTYVAIIKPDADEFVPVGEIGEIAVCGPQVMTEVWKNPERTAKYFAKIEGKTWLRTGDVGRMDEEGWFYFAERIRTSSSTRASRSSPRSLSASSASTRPSKSRRRHRGELQGGLPGDQGLHSP